MVHKEQKMVLEQLKDIIKSKRLTYSHVAQGTEISESSLKKIFAGADCSFSKIMKVCDFLEINFFDLAERINARKVETSFYLNMKQEVYFSNNFNDFLFFYKIYRDNLSVEKTMKLFNMDEKRTWKALRKLEELELLEIMDFPKVKFKVSGGMHFLKEGPLQSKVMKSAVDAVSNFLVNGPLIKEPVDSPFMRLYFAKASAETYASFLEDLRKVHEDFARTAMRDRKFGNEEDLFDVTWLLGLANCHGLDLAYQAEGNDNYIN